MSYALHSIDSNDIMEHMTVMTPVWFPNCFHLLVAKINLDITLQKKINERSTTVIFDNFLWKNL